MYSLYEIISIVKQKKTKQNKTKKQVKKQQTTKDICNIWFDF